VLSPSSSHHLEDLVVADFEVLSAAAEEVALVDSFGARDVAGELIHVAKDAAGACVRVAV